MLLKLGADSNIKDDNQKTPKQFAQYNLLRAIRDINDGYHADIFDYDYFERKFDNCGACAAKKNAYQYWDGIVDESFLECFNECSDTPCYYNFP